MTTNGRTSPDRADVSALRRHAVAWALYDWATSPFAAVIVTFVFPAYFGRAVIGDEVQGTAAWGWMMAANGLVLALLAPLLGASVHEGPARRRWLQLLIGIAVVATFMLWWVRPEPDSAMLALWSVGIAIVALELASVIINGMLPEIASAERMGFWSGLAWGIGYLAGLVVLSGLLYGIILPDPPPFGLDKEAAEPVRLAGPIVAIWLLLFALPIMLSRGPGSGRQTVHIRPMGSLGTRLARLVRTLRAEPVLARFLIARAIYNEGLNTLFAFGGLFAAGTFGMSFEDVLLFGIALNLTAGLGALAFGVLDDRAGSKATLILALLGLLACGSVAIGTSDVTHFWIAGCGLGIFVGPAQAASRTLMARLAPLGQVNELFGIMATTGRVTAFVGPSLVSAVTLMLASQRAGMAVVLLLWGLGLALLWTVRAPER